MMATILNFLITGAYADTASGSTVATPTGGSPFIVMLVILAVFFYFGIMRPQNKRAKEQRNLLDSLVKGDEVVTASGLLGKITNITEPYIKLAVTDNTEIVMQKSAVVSVLPKGTIKTIS